MEILKQLNLFIPLLNKKFVHFIGGHSWYRLYNKGVLFCPDKHSNFKSNKSLSLSLLVTLYADYNRKICISHNVLSKVKNRGGQKKGAAVKVDEREMSQYLNVEKLRVQMTNSLETMKNDFKKNLTLRSSTGSIEHVTVTYENKEYLLQELVQVTRKPNTIILNASTFCQAIPRIIDALSKSGMNLNPQQDGTKIVIPVPKVTKEHREYLSKNAKALFLKCRHNLRYVQNEQLKILKDNSEINSDTFYRLKVQVEELCNEHIREAAKLLELKITELSGSHKDLHSS